MEIKLSDFKLPDHGERPLLVEGAGGLYVPLNEQDCMIDLIEYLGLPVILVSRHYLGSINHTLLSINALKNRGIKIAGLVFSGGDNAESARIITKLAGVPVMADIPEMDVSSGEPIGRALRSLVRPLGGK